jgi:hypothetical protein
MNQRVIIGIVVILVLIGLGWYFWGDTTTGVPFGSSTSTPSGQNSTSTPSQNTNATSTTATTTGTGSVRSLLTRGGNYTCSFESADPAQRVSGTAFVEGNKMRATVRSQQSGSDRVVESNFIRTGTQIYAWTTGSTQGVRTTVSANAPLSLPSSGGISLDENGLNINWNCRPWIPKQEEFTIPTNVNFVAA